MIWRLAWLLSVLLAVPAQAQRVELPVRLVDLPNGDRRFATTLTIDGRPVEVGIDTGSTGLRVLPRGLTSEHPSGGPVSYSYGAGTAFAGDAITVPVGAGGVTGPVRVMRIRQVGCLSGHPDCPVAHADLSAYGIQGDGIAGQGFAAILGIRVQRDAIDNPFVQLGIRRWIVELPRTAAERGRLVLNPEDAEVAGYARIAVAADGTAPGCLVGPERICAPSFFDSGAAGLRVIRAAPFRPWPSGTAATIEVGAGATRQSMMVAIGRRDQAAGLLYVQRPDAVLSFGFAPYFHWSVLYDAAREAIGLKLR